MKLTCYYCGEIIYSEPTWARAKIAISSRPFEGSYSINVPFHRKCYKRYKLRIRLCRLLSITIAALVILLRGIPDLHSLGSIASIALVFLCLTLVAYELLYRVMVLRGMRNRLIRIKRYRKYYKGP